VSILPISGRLNDKGVLGQYQVRLHVAKSYECVANDNSVPISQRPFGHLFAPVVGFLCVARVVDIPATDFKEEIRFKVPITVRFKVLRQGSLPTTRQAPNEH
jgi:hypothetical protein